MAETLTKKQSDALDTYNNSRTQFEQVLRQRRAQIDAKQGLPNLPGQALYLARNNMMSAYKDLTDALPSRIGGPTSSASRRPISTPTASRCSTSTGALFDVMQAPPANAQNSDTPFKDVVDLGTAIARAKGLDAANADAAGRISLGLFFAETNGNQNIGNARSNKYKGSLQTGVAEDQNGQRKWAAIRKSIAAFDPALIARDDKEEARVGNLDQRYNHWTAVRNGLMNAHAEMFAQIPAIVKTLPDQIDQMKLFELIQIIPSPTRSALASGDLDGLSDFRPEDHGLSAQQQHVHLRAGRPGEDVRDLPRNSRRDVAVQRKVRTRACEIRRDQEAGKRLTLVRQSGPSMAHRGSQYSFIAAATPLATMFRRSCDPILSSSSRLMIEPASSRTAAIRVFRSTISSS